MNKYLKYVNSITRLTKEQEYLLIEKWRSNNDILARNFLIYSNLRYVITTIIKYGYFRMKVCSFDELVSEGNLALLRAVKNFDVSYNIPFSTFATYYIRCAILKHLTDSRSLVHIPFKKYFQIRKALTDNNGDSRNASEDLISEFNIPVEKVECLVNNHNIKDSHFEPFACTDCFDSNPEDTIDSSQIEKELKTILTDREYYIIKSRMQDVTFAEIGKKLKICRERVRQIEIIIIDKIRKHLNSKLLKKKSTHSI